MKGCMHVTAVGFLNGLFRKENKMNIKANVHNCSTQHVFQTQEIGRYTPVISYYGVKNRYVAQVVSL